MRTYRFTIGAAEAGFRLDHFLVRRLPQTMSRSMVQRAIHEGRVTLADTPAKPNQKLRAGDAVCAVFPELGSTGGSATLTAQEIPVEIAYEDEWVLVVNKPAGLVTHPAPGHWDGTLVNAILWHLGGGKAAAPLARAGIVHRLDKDTSGLLLVAKTEEAHIALSRQLKARDIHRRYLALVEGHLPLDSGTVNVPIGRHVVHRKEMTVRHLGGRSAVTHYRVIRRFSKGRALPLAYTLLELVLDTGRTHQIRVHMAHLGHPVVGDIVYGDHPPSYWAPLGVSRQMLHAAGLTFQHPVKEKRVVLSAPVPQDMAVFIA